MAEKVEILEIETGNSEQTLKQLKDEIKELRKQLDECAIGSDKFKTTLNDLSAAQDKLKNATKKNNDALEGSYDALVAKMAELKKAWRATADEAERADLGQQISDINNQLKDMDASIGNYQRNVGNYASAFDDVTIKIEEGCMRFDRFNGAARSIIGSFDLVEGGLKAIGVESEGVNEMMDKMQGLMVITNGLTSVKEGVQAFNSMRTAVQSTTAAQKILNAVMTANPIGIIIAGVAALTAGVIALTKAFNDDAEKAKAVTAAYEETTKAIEDQTVALDFEVKMMKAKGVEQDKILRQQYANAKAEFQKWTSEYESLALKYEDTNGLFSGKQKEALKEAMDSAFAEIEKANAKVVAAYQAILIYDEEMKTQNAKNAEENAKNAAAAAKTAKEQILAEYAALKEKLEKGNLTPLEQQIYDLQKVYDKELKLLGELKKKKEINEEEYNRRVEELTVQHYNKIEKLRSDAAEKEKAAAEAAALKEQQAFDTQRKRYTDLYDEILKSQMTADEQKIAQIHSTYIKELELLEELHTNKIISEEEYANALIAIKEKESAAIEEATKKEEAAVDRVTWSTMEMSDKLNAVAGLAGTAFGQTAQMLNTLAAQQDKTSKEGFEAAKKMSIGAAVMSMLQGIIGSWTSAMSLPAPISFITGGLMSAFTATLGGIQIAQIKKQTFQNADKGASGKASVNTPSINTAALMSSPINYTTEVKGAQAEEMIPQKVYVVESDITSTQNKVKTVEEESTF